MVELGVSMSKSIKLSDGKELESTRKGFGKGLLEAGLNDNSVVAVCADLTESTQMSSFKTKFPKRFFNVGVAEQNLVTIASGLAAVGKIPFAASYAAFSPGRNWEQIRTTVCINNQPVKIIGSHAGLYTGKDGATHQMLEDIALMRVLPNMVVIAPVDSIEARKATLAMALDKRPNYLRLTREATPVVTTEATPFEIGKAYIYIGGKDLTLISTGVMTARSLSIAKTLKEKGIDIELIHVPTIKPLDSVTILNSLEKTGRAVVLEEAQIAGGLGGAIAELTSQELPIPVKRIGVNDSFGESGEPEELLRQFGLDKISITNQIEDFIKQTKRSRR